MDIFYFGDRGSGKTLRALIDILLAWYAGKAIWSNTPLHHAFDTNFITKESGNYHYIDNVIDLLLLLVEEDNEKEISNAPKILLLDEIKTQASSRNATTVINKQLGNFVSQARKLNFQIIYTDTIITSYDKWLRQMTDRIVSCEPFKDARDLGLGNEDYPEPLYFGYSEIDIDKADRKPHNYWISRNTARHFYPLYDTKKRVTPVRLINDLKYISDNE